MVHRFQDPAIQARVPVAVPLAVAGTGTVTTVLDRGQEVVVAPVTGGAPTTPKSNLPITLNADVSALSFASPRYGWAIVSGTFCGGFKRHRTGYAALYTTSDGGATWAQLPGT